MISKEKYVQMVELAVSCCLHLIRSDLPDYTPLFIGSGVIIKYKERYFLCTVAHFSGHEGASVGIVTGYITDQGSEICYYKDFTYVTQLRFDVELDDEDLAYSLSNPEKSGDRLDVAFREIELLDNIIQEERTFNIKDIGNICIPKGEKNVLVIDDNNGINTDEFCSFYGRIRPNYQDGSLGFDEQLYSGLTIKSIDDNFITLGFVHPIVDDARKFSGCSGAPVIDTRGKLIGLITHGNIALSKREIYAFRFDKIKFWIDNAYFREPLPSP